MFQSTSAGLAGLQLCQLVGKGVSSWPGLPKLDFLAMPVGFTPGWLTHLPDCVSVPKCFLFRWLVARYAQVCADKLVSAFCIGPAQVGCIPKHREFSNKLWHQQACDVVLHASCFGLVLSFSLDGLYPCIVATWEGLAPKEATMSTKQVPLGAARSQKQR